MIHSMTAFSLSQKQSDAGLLCWEIRSLNHRYLDLSFRMPEPLRFIEPQLRSCLQDKIHRGKVECHLKYQDTNTKNPSMLINRGMINSLLETGRDLSVKYQLENDLSVSYLLSWPGVVQEGQLDMQGLGEEAVTLFVEAVDQLSHNRALEGKALMKQVSGRLNKLAKEVSQAQHLASTLAQTSREKLLARLSVLELEVSEGRIEQELALILARLDVSEELDRLEIHMDEVNRTLNHDKLAGRRLDFLMQELNREANTLSSKSDSIKLTQSAVEMKVLIEQMREQIQNIE